jgi:FkbM family methyltransferase
MGLRQSICRIANPFLRKLDLEMSTRGQRGIVPIAALSQREAVERIAWMKRQLGFEPKAIVDVGASDGRWALPAIDLFPEARFLLIEAQDAHRESLREIAEKNRRVTCYEGIVGEKKGRVTFMVHGHKSSLYGNSRGEEYGRAVEAEMNTLDEIVEAVGFPAPDMIKLDVEGAELRALSGGLRSLESAEVVEMEVSLIPFQKGIPLFHEVVGFMAERGFRVFDVFGIHGRPLDGLPAQGECIFIRADSSLIKDPRWGEGVPWS